MPLRHRLKHFIGGSEAKGTADKPDRTDGDPNTAGLQLKAAKSVLPLAQTTHPQTFQLRGLWSEAYEQLRTEDEQLIVAYEKDLLTQGMAQPGGQNTTDEFDNNHELELKYLVERRLADIQEKRLRVTFGGRDVVVEDQVLRVIHGILSFKDAIASAVNAEPHAALAWAGILILLNPVSRAITQEEGAIYGFEQISDLLIRYRLLECTHIEIYVSKDSSSGPVKPLAEIHASLRTKIINLYKGVLRYQMRLAKHYSHSGLFRFLKDSIAVDNWKDMLKSITEIDQNIKDDLQFLGSHNLKEIGTRIDSLQRLIVTSLDLITEAGDEAKASKQLQLLERLPYAEGAVFNSFKDRGERHCLAGTQVETLTKIQEWVEDPEGRRIFWLRGMAGTGKSTISRTFAAASHDRIRLVTGEPLSSNLCLGASFFFNQYEPTRNNAKRFFTTLAWSLARALPSLKTLVCDAIDKNSRIGDELPENQWKDLILQPILTLETQVLSPLTLVVVVDALDECKPDSDLNLILQLMSRVKDLQIIKIRLFLTSRPEAHIRRYFRGISSDLIHEAVLNKVTVSDFGSNAQNDITHFLTHELLEIKQTNQITEDWPGQKILQMLATKADGLFIYAATVCRFLTGPNLTRSRLDLRLKMISDNKVTGDSPQKNLDEIYTSILRFSVLGDAVEEEKDLISSHFKKVVGSIIVLFEPLSPQCLSVLVNTPLSNVEETLTGLHSVLAVPEKSNDAVHLLHLSFRDFLIDEKRCLDDNFCISEATAHRILFEHSMEMMSTMLQFDICGLRDPATSMTDVEQPQVNQNIPVHLQYACRYWVYHLQHSDVRPKDDGEVHRFLQIHLLHWLEALSLLGKMHEGVRIILVLFDYLATLPAEGRTELTNLAQDARRFVLKFKSVIEQTPLQIYRSALVFSPNASVVRNLFRRYIPEWLHQIPTIDSDWDPLLQTLEKSNTSMVVTDVVFSPDGKLIASSSGHIWDTLSGTLVKKLEPRLDISSIGFSQDSRTLVSVYGKGNVTKWDIATGVLIFEMVTGYSQDSIAILSHNCEMAATAYGYYESTITIIDISGGKSVEIKGAHPHEIMALEFSPDGACLVSAAKDQPVCLWDTTTAELQRALEHPNGASAVAFSPNGRLLASADMDTTVYLWCAETGILLTKIEHTSRIQFLAFSPDSALLAITDTDKSIYLREAVTGSFLRKIDGDFRAPLFSPSGDLLTSTGRRKDHRFIPTNGIKIWETKSGTLAKVVADPGYLAERVSFSPDGSTIASASGTGIRLWDLAHNTRKPACSTHARSVHSVSLMPSTERALSFAKRDSVMLWDLSTAELLSTIPVAEQATWGIALSPDDTLIAAPCSETNIRILDSRTGNLLQELAGHTGIIRTTVFASDSIILASASFAFRRSLELKSIGRISLDHPNSSICVWNAKTGELLQKLDSPLFYIECLSFTTNGKILAAAHADGLLDLWDIRTGKLFKTLGGDRGLVTDITFSPDGNMIASTDRDHRTQLWNVNTNELVWKLKKGGGVVRFSPNGSLLATVSSRVLGIALWDLTTGELLKLCKDMEKIDSINFSEDGEYLDTNMGRLSVKLILPDVSTTPESSKRDPGVFVRNPWVFRGREKILLLPPEYYATCATYRDGVLVMGHEDGRVSILRFDQDGFIDSA